MTEYNEEQASHSAEQQPEEEEKDEFKIYIGRVPTKFTEAIVKRILVEKLGGDAADIGDDDKTVVEKVELIYPHDDDDDENGKNNSKSSNNNPDGYRADRTSNRESTTKDGREKDAEKEHRGFGFVSFATADIRDSALALGTIKGKRKKTSKKSHTMYVRPYVPISDTFDDDGENNAEGGENDSQANNTCTPATTTGRDVCYLWNLHRCPYGDECKFRHVGEGGCTKQDKDLSLSEQKQLKRKRKGKCFTYKKKGKCPKGDECPFSHDFEPDTKIGGTEDDSGEKTTARCPVVVPKTQKDCINWKTKGKCRKGDKCEYKHDPDLQRKALEKIAKKKRQREGGNDDTNNEDDNNKRRRKEKQPISVRVFGLNYDTNEADIKEFIETKAGHPVKSIVFPRFEDSGRSKGYCGVYFASPKAAKDAVEKCDSAELHGRWLRVQTGKSMTVDQWEGLHHKE